MGVSVCFMQVSGPLSTQLCCDAGQGAGTDGGGEEG